MAVTVDEVTAEVSPPPDAAPATQGSAPHANTPRPCEDRRQLQHQLEQLRQRAARVRAD
jgi:hypothetical protein